VQTKQKSRTKSGAAKATTKSLSIPAWLLAESLAKAHRLQITWSGFVCELLRKNLRG
jgi:hypothetical protein